MRDSIIDFLEHNIGGIDNDRNVEVDDIDDYLYTCRMCLTRLILKTHSKYCLRKEIRLDAYFLFIFYFNMNLRLLRGR